MAIIPNRRFGRPRWSCAAFALAAAFCAGPSATAQVSLDPVRVTGPVRHAGTYHVSTGQWTRHSGSTASFGPDVVYANTAASGYFTSTGGAGGFFPGAEVFDEGGLPGTTNPDVFAIGANRDEYSINCFEFGYCDFGGAGTGGWDISFYHSFMPCVAPVQAPAAVVELTGLPAGGCWFVAIDLSGGNEFCMQADAGQTGQAAQFGWSYEYAGTDGTAAAGFLLAGDPATTDVGWVPGALPRSGFDTYYGGVGPCGATGYLTEDSTTIVSTAGVNCGPGAYANTNGCGSAAFNPYSSFYFQMHADTDACRRLLSSTYCQSNPNVTGVNGQLEVLGRPDPLADDATLRAYNLSPNQFGFFITSPNQGFVMNPAGSLGNLCLSGAIGRFVAPGQIKNSGPDGEIVLTTLTSEWSLTAVPSPTGPFGVGVGTTMNFQAWHRDVGGTPQSNFTNGVTLTW